MYSRSLIIGGSTALASAVLALAGTSAAGASAAPKTSQIAPPRVSVPPPSAMQRRVPSRQMLGLTQVRYTNWAGYADSGSNEKYSMVKSSFIQPTLTCDKTAKGYQVTVFWDGIDGFANGTVEQGGTEGYCHNGKGPFYDTWWEQYPKNDIQDVGTTVHAGDRIAVSVVRNGTEYTVKVTDATRRPNSFTHSFSCPSSTCADTSAEWIAEAPTNTSNDTLYPLVKFSKWTNSNSSVANASMSGTIKTFPDDEITMVNSRSQVKAKPGPLNSAGTAFGVTFQRSS